MTTRPDRKRKGSPEWIRLGELLTIRRAELDPAWFDRGVFAVARGINLKLAQDIEKNARENFTPLTLRDVIAPAYGVTFTSIEAVLNEDGDLEPLPGTPAHKPPRSLRLERQDTPALSAVPPLPGDEQEEKAIQAVLRGDGERFPEFSPGIAAAIGAHVPGIRDAAEKAARAEAARRGVPVLAVLREVPPGPLVFPGDGEYARLWDEWRQNGSPGLKFTVAQLIRGAAQRRVQDQVLAQRAGGTSSGLPPAP